MAEEYLDEETQADVFDRPETEQPEEEEPEAAWVFHHDIVGMTEIAQRLGVGYFRVRRWNERRRTTKCPKPIVVLKTGPLWDMQDWHGWWRLWRLTRGSESWNRNGDNANDDD